MTQQDSDGYFNITIWEFPAKHPSWSVQVPVKGHVRAFTPEKIFKTSHKSCLVFFSALALLGSREGATCGWRQGPLLDEPPGHYKALCEHLWVGALLKGTLAVFWRCSGTFSHYQTTVCVVVCTGAGTKTPPLLTPVPNRRSFQLHDWAWEDDPDALFNIEDAAQPVFIIPTRGKLC